MGSKTVGLWFVFILVAVVFAVDFLFLEHHFLARLLVNIGIVLVFVVLGMAFLRRP